MKENPFNLTIKQLQFDREPLSLRIDGVLQIGTTNLVWSADGVGLLNVAQLSELVHSTLHSFSHSESSGSFDLSTSGQRVVVRMKAGQDRHSIECDVEIEGRPTRTTQLWSGDLDRVQGRLYSAVVRYCCSCAVDPTTIETLLRSLSQAPLEARFRIGERVRTVPSENVRTEREGWIYGKTWHFDRKSIVYTLLADGRLIKKWYFDEDLVAVRG